MVNQNACTPEDLKLCPADGPGNNEYLDSSPVCTILSAITQHDDFEALELKRTNADVRNAKPREAQSVAMAAAEQMEGENKDGTDGPRDATAGGADVAAMLEARTPGMVQFVRFLACNPTELGLVDFVCAKIREALEEEAGRRYYHLLDVARQATNSLLLRLGNRAGSEPAGLASPEGGGGEDEKKKLIEKLESEIARLKEELAQLKQAQNAEDSLDQTHASTASERDAVGDSFDGAADKASIFPADDDELMLSSLSPVPPLSGTPAKSGDKRARSTPLGTLSPNKNPCTSSCTATAVV